MACGVYPVAGRLESVEEWIEDGVNGRLVELDSAASLAAAMLEALEDEAGREKARKANLQLIAERADYAKVMPRVETFYREVIASAKNT